MNFPVKSTGSFGNPFSDEGAVDGGGTRHCDFNIAGRVTKATAKGTLGVKIVETDAAGVATTCDTGKVTWKVATG